MNKLSNSALKKEFNKLLKESLNDSETSGVISSALVKLYLGRKDKVKSERKEIEDFEIISNGNDKTDLSNRKDYKAFVKKMGSSRKLQEMDSLRTYMHIGSLINSFSDSSSSVPHFVFLHYLKMDFGSLSLYLSIDENLIISLLFLFPDQIKVLNSVFKAMSQFCNGKTSKISLVMNKGFSNLRFLFMFSDHDLLKLALLAFYIPKSGQMRNLYLKDLGILKIFGSVISKDYDLDVIAYGLDRIGKISLIDFAKEYKFLNKTLAIYDWTHTKKPKLNPK